MAKPTQYKPVIQSNIETIKKICTDYQINQLWAFGSVVSDKFNERSDIDLLVSFKPMEWEDYADNYFVVCDLFEKLFNQKVDLVTTNSLSNPYFIKSVEQSKVLLYEWRSSKIYYDIKTSIEVGYELNC